MAEKREMVLVVGTDMEVRVVVRDDLPPRTAYFVDPKQVVQTDLVTGETTHPFAAT